MPLNFDVAKRVSVRYPKKASFLFIFVFFVFHSSQDRFGLDFREHRVDMKEREREREREREITIEEENIMIHP
jgi:hypothetical protein